MAKQFSSGRDHSTNFLDMCLGVFEPSSWDGDQSRIEKYVKGNLQMILTRTPGPHQAHQGQLALQEKIQRFMRMVAFVHYFAHRHQSLSVTGVASHIFNYDPKTETPPAWDWLCGRIPESTIELLVFIEPEKRIQTRHPLIALSILKFYDPPMVDLHLVAQDFISFVKAESKTSNTSSERDQLHDIVYDKFKYSDKRRLPGSKTHLVSELITALGDQAGLRLLQLMSSDFSDEGLHHAQLARYIAAKEAQPDQQLLHELLELAITTTEEAVGKVDKYHLLSIIYHIKGNMEYHKMKNSEHRPREYYFDATSKHIEELMHLEAAASQCFEMSRYFDDSNTYAYFTHWSMDLFIMKSLTDALDTPPGAEKNCWNDWLDQNPTCFRFRGLEEVVERLIEDYEHRFGKDESYLRALEKQAKIQDGWKRYETVAKLDKMLSSSGGIINHLSARLRFIKVKLEERSENASWKVLKKDTTIFTGCLGYLQQNMDQFKEFTPTEALQNVRVINLTYNYYLQAIRHSPDKRLHELDLIKNKILLRWEFLLPNEPLPKFYLYIFEVLKMINGTDKDLLTTKNDQVKVRKDAWMKVKPYSAIERHASIEWLGRSDKTKDLGIKQLVHKSDLYFREVSFDTFYKIGNKKIYPKSTYPSNPEDPSRYWKPPKVLQRFGGLPGFPLECKSVDKIQSGRLTFGHGHNQLSIHFKPRSELCNIIEKGQPVAKKYDLWGSGHGIEFQGKEVKGCIGFSLDEMSAEFVSLAKNPQKKDAPFIFHYNSAHMEPVNPSAPPLHPLARPPAQGLFCYSCKQNHGIQKFSTAEQQKLHTNMCLDCQNRAVPIKKLPMGRSSAKSHAPQVKNAPPAGRTEDEKPALSKLSEDVGTTKKKSSLPAPQALPQAQTNDESPFEGKQIFCHGKCQTKLDREEFTPIQADKPKPRCKRCTQRR